MGRELVEEGGHAGTPLLGFRHGLIVLRAGGSVPASAPLAVEGRAEDRLDRPAEDRATTPGDVLDRVGRMAHSFETDTEAQGLIDFVDASPTPFHACEQAARRLGEAGFTEVVETQQWPSEPGRHYLVRGGSLIAWDTTGAHAAGAGPAAGFRVVGAHTDSPNLRLKPNADHVKAGWQMLAVEPYGGLILNSWLDRDLGLAGRVTVRTADGIESRLFHDAAPDPAGRAARDPPRPQPERRADSQQAAAHGAAVGRRRPARRRPALPRRPGRRRPAATCSRGTS